MDRTYLPCEETRSHSSELEIISESWREQGTFGNILHRVYYRKAPELLKEEQAFIARGGCEHQASSLTLERVKESVPCVPSKKKQMQESCFML